MVDFVITDKNGARILEFDAAGNAEAQVILDQQVLLKVGKFALWRLIAKRKLTTTVTPLVEDDV